jgi:putative oxidoreductase
MKDFLEKFISTDDDIGILAARLTLGVVMFPHGAQKLFGLFGGGGFSGTLNYFVSSGLPAVLAVLIILGESLGSIALIFGFFSRFMAFGIGLIMLGAIFMVHLPNGFFMNWFGKQPGEGFEYHILAVGLSLVIMIKGSGAFSIDRLIKKYLK